MTHAEPTGIGRRVGIGHRMRRPRGDVKGPPETAALRRRSMPDGRAAFYQDGDGVLRQFLTAEEDLVEVARSRVQRTFTDAECERFFPEGECPT